MRGLAGSVRRFYGARPLHLLAMVAALALAAYVVGVVGPTALWDTQEWWHSILVWFVGAAVLHDLVVFPVYALADRGLVVAARLRRPLRRTPLVHPLNYLRVPALAAGLTFLLFFPGIVSQGSASYLTATGQTQAPFLARWLLLVAAFFALSAAAYAVRLLLARRAARSPAPATSGR